MADTAPTTPAKKGRKPKDGAKKDKSDRPPTMDLVIEAIEAEKDTKGTSVMAIKKYIMANHKVKSAKFLNHMMRRALEAGLADGKLTRPKGQAQSHLLMGRYRLAAKEKTKSPKAASEPKPKKAAAKSPAKKAAAKPKRVKTPKKPAAAAKKAKSPKKVKTTPKKPAAKKTAAKKSPKKAAKKA